MWMVLMLLFVSHVQLCSICDYDLCWYSCCNSEYVYLRALTHTLICFALCRSIIYLDETWVNAGHTKEYVWQDKTVKSSHDAFLKGLTAGLPAPSGKGARLILFHGGSSATGFVPGAADYFQANKGNNTDYHSEMDGKSENKSSTSNNKIMASTSSSGSPTSFCQTFLPTAMLTRTMLHTTA